MIGRRIEKYLQRNAIPPTRFGRAVARDPRLVFDIRNGRELGVQLERRIAAYLDDAEAREGGRCAR